jgi:quercetin dioxygenase-like cupin family protein
MTKDETAQPGATVVELAALLPEILPDSIISRSVFGNDLLKGTIFGFAAGEELTEHTASRPAILHFLSGEAELTLGDRKLVAQPGTWAYMPARLPHSIVAIRPTAMLLLMLNESEP